jgi:hypothetical protein
MDFTSNTLFDDAIDSNFLGINLGQEYQELGGLCAYNNQRSYNGYNHVIAPLDLGSLNSLDLITPHSAFGSISSQVLLQVPTLNNNLSASFPSEQTEIAPSEALQRSNSNVSRRSSSDGGDKDTTGRPGRIFMGTCEAESKSEDSGTTVPKKRRQRKRKRQLTPAEEEAKHRKFLERNRLAASKCRQKKKKQTDHLEEKKTILEGENRLLKLQLGEARDEVNILKNFIMMHASYNHITLSSWIENEAICTAVYPTPALGLSNLISPAAEPDTERSCTGVPLTQESLISQRASIAFIEQDSLASSSSVLSTTVSLELAEQPSTTFCELWSPADSGVEI